MIEDHMNRLYVTENNYVKMKDHINESYMINNIIVI